MFSSTKTGFKADNNSNFGDHLHRARMSQASAMHTPAKSLFNESSISEIRKGGATIQERLASYRELEKKQVGNVSFLTALPQKDNDDDSEEEELKV